MADYFSLMQLPRVPWLEVEVVRQKFLELSRTVHPDHYHAGPAQARSDADERFKAINAAYDCLRDPKARLHHLIELETGSPPREVQQIRHDTTNRFMEISHLCRGVDEHLKKQAPTVSPLLRVRAIERNLEWVEAIQAMLGQLENWRNDLHRRIREINDSWIPSTGDPNASRNTHDALLTELERCYCLLSYESRWTSQLKERMFRLSTAT